MLLFKLAGAWISSFEIGDIRTVPLTLADLTSQIKSSDSDEHGLADLLQGHLTSGRKYAEALTKVLEHIHTQRVVKDSPYLAHIDHELLEDTPLTQDYVKSLYKPYERKKAWVFQQLQDKNHVQNSNLVSEDRDFVKLAHELDFWVKTDVSDDKSVARKWVLVRELMYQEIENDLEQLESDCLPLIRTLSNAVAFPPPAVVVEDFHNALARIAIINEFILTELGASSFSINVIRHEINTRLDFIKRSHEGIKLVADMSDAVSHLFHSLPYFHPHSTTVKDYRAQKLDIPHNLHEWTLVTLLEVEERLQKRVRRLELHHKSLKNLSGTFRYMLSVMEKHHQTHVYSISSALMKNVLDKHLCDSDIQEAVEEWMVLHRDRPLNYSVDALKVKLHEALNSAQEHCSERL